MGRAETRDLFRGFDAWGFDAKDWSANTRKRYYYAAKRADEWLAENRNTSLPGATDHDLEAFLWSTKPTARSRNNIRAALVGLYDFLIHLDFTTTNPAHGLPKLRVPKSTPRACVDVRQAAARPREAARH
jgi:site-specific recombinase XerD